MTVVCIAGMHRSGTSMVARVLNLCGLFLGEESDLLPAWLDNQEGYWENMHFLNINEKILFTIRGGWDFPPNVKPGWENSHQLDQYRREAQQLIKSMEPHPLWGWKDPRNSLTLPFWQQLIPDLKVIVCLRDPHEIAMSLSRRGSSSEIFSMHLWQIYYQQVIGNVKQLKWIITHYDAFLYDGKAELRRLLAFLNLAADDQQIDEAIRAINPTLKHNKSTLANPASLNNYVETKKFYAALCRKSGPVFQHAKGEPAINTKS